GYVPAYAATGADVEPTPRRVRRAGRVTERSPEGVSAAEFEEMKRDLDLDLADDDRGGRTSTLTKRLAHSTEDDAPEDAPAPRASRPGSSAITRRSRRADGGTTRGRSQRAGSDRTGSERAGNGAPEPPQQPRQQPPQQPEAQEPPADDVKPAPDAAENEGVAPSPKRPQKPRSRNRRHGRRR
ncbi:MAG: hypothetical protein JO325_20090, partial [Solirubrobacterales bacterium]|nr:hypothetical protein [Solirubrobacterales bacterium]